MANKYIVIIILLAAGILASFGITAAIDPPHNDPENVFCNSCHVMHRQLGNSYGGSLTKDSNANLCLSCHVDGGVASNWAFASSDQAVPGVSGISHRWDRDMTPGAAPLNLALSNPDNAFGLRTPSELANPGLKTIMTKFSNVVVCSTCHQQHSQVKTPYDPYAYNASAGDGGGTASGGSLNTLADSSKTWSADQWAGYILVMTGGTASNIGQARTILGNTGSPSCTLTLSSRFPAAVNAGDSYYITMNSVAFDSGTAVAASDVSHIVDNTKSWTTNWAGYYVKIIRGTYNAGQRRRIQSSTGNTLTLAYPFDDPVGSGDAYYITSGRHYMRINDDTADLCVDCHYYRSSSSVNGSVYQTDVRAWDGNKKSHPVARRLSDVSDPTQFNSSLLEGYCSGPLSCYSYTMAGCAIASGCTWTWAAQGGTRGEMNGGSDANLTNNITTDTGGRINCLSCHNVHYADSDSTTVDTPSGYAP